MKRFLTTSNHLFSHVSKKRELGQTLLRAASTFEAKSLGSEHQRSTHSLTFQDKLAVFSKDQQALTMLEEKLHVSHTMFEKILDNVINTITGSWLSELESVKELWELNKGSKDIKKCNALIKDIETYPVYLADKVNKILCEAYIFKGDFLRLTGALEKQALEAFECYKKALEIIPDHQAAKSGIENLRIIRGESTKTIV
ncbi:MAG: hypothetical protein JSS09_03825, partial [Verrucomicrobia bacterium]|nr:hypothetical protein [Verrucomicrobiota bacterium]